MHRTPSAAAASRGIALLLALALAIAACGTPATSPSPSNAAPSPSAPASPSATPPSTPAASPSAGASGDQDALYDGIEEQVAAIRGLAPTASVDRQTLSEDELVAMLDEQYGEENPPEYVAANERLYKALGLLPADADLRQMSLDLLGAGVAGFYRPDQKKMYIVSRSGKIGGSEKTTYAHEFTHALQDQHYPVFTDLDGVLDQTDRVYANQAAYEGDASLVMTYWAIANLDPSELGDLLAVDPEQQAVIDRMPPILRETLLFPYTTGAFFVQSLQMAGGWPAVDGLLERLPASTEQILHSEKYTAGEAPIAVELPKDLATDLGAGWSVPLLDTFGELQMRIWLAQGGVAAPAAEAAAAGWGGDRLAVIEGPDGAWALAMRTAWDTAADAAEFEKAATVALSKAGGPGRVLPGDGGTTRWVVIGDSDATLSHVAGALGLAG